MLQIKNGLSHSQVSVILKLEKSVWGGGGDFKGRSAMKGLNYTKIHLKAYIGYAL